MQRNLIISASAFLIGLCAAFVYLREPMIDLTDESLASAISKWRASQIGDYDMSYTINGQAFDMSVRKNAVEHLLMNGVRPQINDEDAYTVEGLFETLAMELENLADPNGPFSAGQNVIYMRVRFNQKLGYIERYLRSGGAGGKGVSIEAVQFQPLR